MSNSDSHRWQQRHDTFGRALQQLTSACALDEFTWLELAGLIKSFEFCFELAWKVLKDLLYFECQEVRSPRAAIRGGFAAGYINEQDCQTMLDALENRNTLTHGYGSDLAVRAEQAIKDQYHPVLLRLCHCLDAKRTS